MTSQSTLNVALGKVFEKFDIIPLVAGAASFKDAKFTKCFAAISPGHWTHVR